MGGKYGARFGAGRRLWAKVAYQDGQGRRGPGPVQFNSRIFAL